MALCEIYKEDVAYLQRIADGLAIQGEYLSSATVFRKAIALSQSPECRSVERFSNPVILDIGCGSGILSIVSARTTKAKKIIAFSETVDSAIFGENILSTIQDAQDRLLKEDSIVIPSKATLYFAALESPDIATRSSCELGDIVLLSTNCFSHYNLESNVDSGYTCAHLAELTHGYNILSELIEAISVDFNDRHQMELLNSGTFRTNCKLRIIKGGVINGITSWFKLYTYENISISSSPTSHSSWQQAILPVYPPLIVQANETVEIELFLKEGAQLIAMPISQPKVAKELLRVHGTNRFDFPALNDLPIREFFKKAIGSYKNLLDLTDLFLFRHIDLKDRITKVKTKNSLVQRLAQPDQLELDDFVPDAILFWPVSTRGWLSDEKITELLECASYWPKAVIIPTEIVLNGYLFSRNDLCSRSRLSEGQHLDIDLMPMDEY
uniref:Uncharacterized protein n=1 Tax=Acrobeloides nanus TaxID=290746 RepID=A0A914BWN9_9BILA